MYLSSRNLNFNLLYILPVLLPLLWACPGKKAQHYYSYPETHKVDVVDDYFGTQVEDPYRWLEDTASDDVQNWIDTQNEFTESVLSQVKARENYRNRLSELIQKKGDNPPWSKANKWFQYRTAQGENLPVLYWGREKNNVDQVLLDLNALSKEKGELILINYADVSPSGKFLSYGLSQGGSDWTTGYVKNIETGEELPDTLTGLRFTETSWVPDSSGFYYLGFDVKEESESIFGGVSGQAIRFHRLRQPQTQDEIVYKDEDGKSFVNAEISEDGEFLIITSQDVNSFLYKSIRYRPLKSKNDFTIVANPDGSHILYIGKSADRIFLLTFYEAPNGRVISFKADNPDPAKWKDIVPESKWPLAPRGSVVMVDKWIVSVHEYFAQHKVRITAFEGSSHIDLEPPLPGRIPPAGGYGTLQISANTEKTKIHIGWTSYLFESLTLVYDVKTHSCTLLEEPSDPSDYKAYKTQVVWATSPDGTEIPMTLVCRNDIRPNGNQPVLFYAYGAAGIPVGWKLYRPWWVVWLEKGGVLVQIHARGGGEFGKEWHFSAQGKTKQRTFDDCIACVEKIIEDGWTRPSRAAFNGGSAGGMATGAIFTQRPDLFAAVIPERGLYDMLRYHILAYSETKEVGSSKTEDGFETLYAWSPLHAIKQNQVYPAVLIIAGEYDDRVNPSSSYKFGAALQAAQSEEDPPILLRVQRGAGHGTVSQEDSIRERADVLAFLSMALELIW